MRVVQTKKTGVWHLGAFRGCGAEPDGETVEGNWAGVRDCVDLDGGEWFSR